MLFLQGTRDALADLAMLKPVVKGLGKRATLCLFDEADHSFHVPARTGRTHLRAVLHRIITAPRLEGAGATELATSIERLGSTMRRRGLAVIVSDWLDPTPWQMPLRRLAGAGASS